MAIINTLTQANPAIGEQLFPSSKLLDLPPELISHIIEIITSIPKEVASFISIQLTCSYLRSVATRHPFYRKHLSLNLQFYQKIQTHTQFHRVQSAVFFYCHQKGLGVLTKSSNEKWSSRFIKLNPKAEIESNVFMPGRSIGSLIEGTNIYLSIFLRHGLQPPSLNRFKADDPASSKEIHPAGFQKTFFRNAKTLIALSTSQCCVVFPRKVVLLTIKNETCTLTHTYQSPSSKFMAARKIQNFLALQTEKHLILCALPTLQNTKILKWPLCYEKIYFTRDGFFLSRIRTLNKYKISESGELKKTWTYLLPTKATTLSLNASSSPEILLKLRNKKFKISSQFLLSSQSGKFIKAFNAEKSNLPSAIKEGLCVIAHSSNNNQSLEICLVKRPKIVYTIPLSDQLGKCEVLDMRIYKAASRIHLGLLLKQKMQIFFILYRTPDLEKRV